MKRKEVIRLAESLGWKAWGKLRKYRGSSYQCFRRGNDYAWIGLWFVERSCEPIAQNFIIRSQKEVRKFLS